MEPERVGKSDCSILQRVRNKIEKAFLQGESIKTWPFRED
jgi:hypothetical protein